MIRSDECLRRLGAGEPIEELCNEYGVDRAEFDRWWREECRRRVPPSGSTELTGPYGPARIERDAHGVPHISAATDSALFFGFGYATGQDRLFQLDHLRRKAAGRLAEVLGVEAIESDRLFRTLNLAKLAEREWIDLPDETRGLVEAYAAGVDAVIASLGDTPPIEFDLLDYRPEAWRPVDCLLVLNEFRWYLTVRFPVIAGPELVKRAVGDGPLFREFLAGEADDESILHPGEYPAGRRREAMQSSGEAETGSNNWVLAAARSRSGKPIVASDPHVPFAAVSIWYQAVLTGGSFRVAGASLAGTPAIMLGRNPDVAWGITNNICSLRDLYQEKTDAALPGCFLFDGRWEPATVREETIRVRGAADVRFTIRSSRNGPIVDEVLPAPARHTGPVSLRWQGFEPCGWLTSMLAMNRARSAADFRAAGENWGVPTFNLVFADTAGHIGFQTVGKLPVRETPMRGYRPGWDPAHQWKGVIPYAELPSLTDPPRGFVVTANNRLAPNDFPWPLSGTWPSGHRARRARERIEADPLHTADGQRSLQLDVYSGQSAAIVPALLDVLGGDAEFAAVVKLLRKWDFEATVDSAAASVSYLFHLHWLRAVLRERLPADQVELNVPFASGMAARLLCGDPLGWFKANNREDAIRAALRTAIAELASRFGSEPAGWSWGRMHTLTQKHVLSGRGDLGVLLDRSGRPVPGDGWTLFNAASDPASHTAISGAGYRMIADLADPHGTLWAIEVAGASGHPGSPHYDDEIEPWLAGAYRAFPLGTEPAGRKK
ncbi:MAG: penicillin acylase family protein [Gemmataceae bacterium]